MSKHVVYVIDENAEPTGRFLAVEKTREAAEEQMKKWWKAFDSGKKKEPIDYGGITIGHVASFDEWVSPEEYAT